MITSSATLTLPLIGNDGMASLVEPWCELFCQSHADLAFDCILEGSSTAIMALAADASWLAPISRAPWAYELAAFQQLKGYLPTAIYLGYTGHGPRAGAKSPPAIYAHHSNPLTGLTMAQVAAIFSTGSDHGSLHSWRQLGLEGKWQDRRIHLYGLHDDGKYATAFRQFHLGGRHYPVHYEALPDRQAVVAAVADDPFGLGCVGWFNAVNYAGQVDIVPLAYRAGEPYYTPDLQHVAQGLYPLSSLVAVYVDLPPGQPLDPLKKAWLEGALSPEGQAIVAAQTHSAEGYVPLEAGRAKVERERLALM